MNFSAVLFDLLIGKNLTQSRAYAVLRSLLRGQLKKYEARAFLVLLAQKGETEGEVLGCLKAVRELEPVLKVRMAGLMDTCGTGGDQSHSFNVSTLSALVIAGAGGKVAKHGNRAISSKCGSSDLMEALGVNLQASPGRMAQSIRRYGIGYFHAPRYHPVFSSVQPLRRELGIRTIFNLMGPLLNPLDVKTQLMGVAKKEYLTLYAQVLKKMKDRRAMIVHSSDGLDEISCSAPTTAVIIRQGRINVMHIHPKKYGIHCSKKSLPKGGSPETNAKLAVALLQGRLKGPLRDCVVLNAGAGLYLSGRARDLKQGIAMANQAIHTGKAYQALEGLKHLSCKS